MGTVIMNPTKLVRTRQTTDSLPCPLWLLSLASKLLVHTLASAAVHFFLIIHQSFLSMELGLGLG
jgi:hypothetical protein